MKTSIYRQNGSAKLKQATFFSNNCQLKFFTPKEGDLGKCQLENNIFLFFYNAIIPKNVVHLYAIYHLSSLLEVGKVTSQPL